MKIGGKYRIREIGRHEWRKLAAELRLDEDRLLTSVEDLATRIPDLAASLLTRVRKDGLTHDVLVRLADTTSSRARECLTGLSR